MASRTSCAGISRSVPSTRLEAGRSRISTSTSRSARDPAVVVAEELAWC